MIYPDCRARGWQLVPPSITLAAITAAAMLLFAGAGLLPVWAAVVPLAGSLISLPWEIYMQERGARISAAERGER